MRTRVKICGITRPEDVQAAAEHGADAIGLVFYPDSPRHVTIESATSIAASVPPFLTLVGLFVNEQTDAIRKVIETVPLDLLQFHGDEDNDECSRYGLPFIKAIPMKPGTDLSARCDAYPDASGLLLDTWLPDSHGGGGKTFNWDEIPMNLPVPIILAGGLSPGNVAAAIQQVKPYAVDVSSGVESEKGIKSADKIAAFMQAVRQCEGTTQAE